MLLFYFCVRKKNVGFVGVVVGSMVCVCVVVLWCFLDKMCTHIELHDDFFKNSKKKLS